MGQEVSHSHFSKNDYKRFSRRLQEETQLLTQQMDAGMFSSHAPMGGFEIEAWLVDEAMRPAPKNIAFFERFKNLLATPELAQFNIELNNTPLLLKGTALNQFECEMRAVFEQADAVAQQLNSKILLTGILPTAINEDFCVENMSAMKRYRALNETTLNARDNQPLKLDIQGKQHFKIEKHSVMIEAATTSFQIHLQTPWKVAHHYYNASIIASAPLMAVASNSPFLFGKQLWHETRIPLFEQAVDTGPGLRRVTFGTSYANNSISECFAENLNMFPVLLPMLFDGKPEEFNHLRLHNGVIWRWNRPLVGFDEDGTPHIRVEQRVLPAGPTVVDMMANAAFFYGITQNLMEEISAESASDKMPFATAKNNFYQAAQSGLQGVIEWGDNSFSGSSLQGLIIEDLLPRAKLGLVALGISNDSAKYYLDIIAERTASGQTGAVWQINHLPQVGGNMQQLTADYLHHQHIGNPVHTWEH